MYTIKNLTIIGTSHISPESAKEISSVIETSKPSVIALELDLARFQKLLSKKTPFKISSMFQSGFFLNLIGAYLERYLGKKIGTSPGLEMKKAISLARKYKIPLALIDQDIRLTLQKLKSRFTFKEKLTFFKNILKSIFYPQEFHFDLTKVPEQKLINQLTLQVKRDYPSLYKTLIEERDDFLAHKLLKLMENNEQVLGIIGAGHLPGVIKIIKCNSPKKKPKL